jgi:hypothetical protein
MAIDLAQIDLANPWVFFFGPKISCILSNDLSSDPSCGVGADRAAVPLDPLLPLSLSRHPIPHHSY